MASKGEKNLTYGPWSWTKDEIKLLKRLYPKGKTKIIAERLGRPLTAVRQKAYDMGMKTDTYNYWVEDKVKLLVKLYPDTKNNELAKRIGRPVESVKAKARQLGLKKSRSHLKTIHSRPRKRPKKKV